MLEAANNYFVYQRHDSNEQRGKIAELYANILIKYSTRSLYDMLINPFIII